MKAATTHTYKVIACFRKTDKWVGERERMREEDKREKMNTQRKVE